MNSRVLILFTITALLVGATTFVPNVLSLLPDKEELPSFQAAPSFVLTNADDEEFSSQKLAGKVWIAQFFFTSCKGPCPLTTRHLGELRKKLDQNSEIPFSDVQFVSISVDPEIDTPEKLQGFATRYKADPRVWNFLRGEQQVVNQILEAGFKIGVMDQPQFHSTRVVLVDQNNFIRGYFSGTDKESIAELGKSIQKLL